ncbi:glycosyltransferase involved in cell wall biosynthesis [Branchiibius hedensis]|uniref:D-inositol 3-phosphate glycosyltransferase n=1 Tax=Branchiibius hedensis TaxID=672460 RepID=A0A2Y8ZLP5_9MICO|nr:glycosyltransferase [Branchiibius hedensis]PWJ24443.1 glycosyltransferase involved in cell wall biosynthesis [Branchiibius hedensis]SSA33260.1 Glycosyltransferase involved in cell wall bisynthesis [Branchiibius hedensis]
MTDATRRPRVAIIGTRGYPSYYGGFETLVRHLAPYLWEHGWDVEVYSRPGQTVPAEADPRIRVRFTPGVETTSLSTLSYGLTSTTAAAARKPDVALVMNVANGFFLPALKARGIPVVMNVDGLEWEREKWGPKAKQVFLAGARASARWADQLISDSTNIAAYWKRVFARESTFIPYGGECDETMLDSAPVAALDGLEPGNYVMVAARLVPENSIDLFLQAARDLPSSAHVVIVGGGDETNPLWNAAVALRAERPNVHLLGQVKNDNFLNWLWANAGVYFHGHSVGGTNPSLVQAMSCGAVIVARDSVFNREVLGPDGHFVPPEAGAIAREISAVLAEPETRAQMSKQASARAEDFYSWGPVLAQYEQLLRAELTTDSQKESLTEFA